MKKVAKRIVSKVSSEIKDFDSLLKAVPALIVTLFILSVVMMNLMANKVIFRWGNFVAADGGLLLSWIPFLCMDIIVKRFGPKAATKLNVFAVLVNVVVVAIFALIAGLKGDGSDYSAFNTAFSSEWFILLGSTVAMIIAAIVNNFSNYAIGKAFKKNPDGRLAYVTRSYVSTFLGQFVDNSVFAFIVFVVFGPMFWAGFEPFTLLTCVGCGLAGAVLELLMEIIFSPIGYKVLEKWKRDGIGESYLNKEAE